MNNQRLFKIIIYNNCNEIVQSIDLDKFLLSSILPEPFNNIKLYVNPSLSELSSIKEKCVLSSDNKYVLGIEKYTINNKLYFKTDNNKTVFLLFVEYLMNNITYESKTYIFNNTTELKYPVYKIEFINENEKIILTHSIENNTSNLKNNSNNNLKNISEYSINQENKDYSKPSLIKIENLKAIQNVQLENTDYLFTLIHENSKENCFFKTILILNKYNFIDIINEKPVLTDIYEPIGTKIVQTVLNQTLINNSYSELCKTMSVQEEIYKKNLMVQEQKIKQLEEDTKNIRSINSLHKELISNINSTMSIIKKYEKSYKECEDSIKQQQEIFQKKVINIENECIINNPEEITKEELVVNYNNLLKVLMNKNLKITSQEQDNKKLQESLSKCLKENLILKSEKDRLTEQSKIKSSPRTPRFSFNPSPPLSPRLDFKPNGLKSFETIRGSIDPLIVSNNKMDELIKSIHDISNNNEKNINDKDNLIKMQQDRIKQLNDTIKEKDDRIKDLINSCESAYKLVKEHSNNNTDIIEIYKELLKEYISFIKNLIIILNVSDQNIIAKLNILSEKILEVIDNDSLKKIKSDILFIEGIINNQHKNKIIINTETIETLINCIININIFIKEIIGYVAKINTGQQLNADVLTSLFDKYDENCNNINVIIKPLIQNYLPSMKNLLIDETEYNIEEYDDSDEECNEDSYDEDSDVSESESETESETDDETNNKQYNKRQNNIIVSPSNFKPKYGQIYIEPVQVNGQVNGQVNNGNYQVNKQINRQDNYQVNRQMNRQDNYQVNIQRNELVNKNVVNKGIDQQKNNRNLHKNKIKTVNTQATKLLNMLITSYNKQYIKK